MKTSRACACGPFPPWMKGLLVAAGLYHLTFAIWLVGWPPPWLHYSDSVAAGHPEVWPSLGVTVGVITGLFGMGYLIAAHNPLRYWAIVLLGLIAKALGSLALTYAIFAGVLPIFSAWMLITNGLIWALPFAIFLWQIAQTKLGKTLLVGKPLTTKEAADIYQLSTGETLAAAATDKTLTLVFLRHFGCTFTRQILRSLQDLKQLSDSHDSRLVLIHMMAANDHPDGLMAATSQHIPRIADPNCELYRAFGLGKGSFLALFGPRVWLRGIRALLKGCGAGHLAGDGLQMPGAFLYRDGQIIAQQPARTAADLPDLPQLFDAIGKH